MSPPSITVTCARDARAYPLRRPDGVWAPQRVSARIKSAHDERRIESAHDERRDNAL
jgi:hypothetical protein